MIKQGRIEVQDQDDYMEVSIRLIRNLYVIIPLLTCAFVWFLGLLFLFEKVFRTYRTIIEMGIAGLFFFWLILGGLIFSTIYWIFKGREKIMITPDHIQIEKPIHLYIRRRLYPLESISNIRINREIFKVKRKGIWQDDQRVVIKFETPNKSVTFGRGISEEEAEFILLELAKYKYLKTHHFGDVTKIESL